MKARGGYLTAFLFAHLALWLLVGRSREVRLRPEAWTLIGAAGALVYFAQPIWLLVLLPFLGYRAYEDRDARKIGLAALGAGGIAGWVILGRSGPIVWSPDLFQGLDAFGAAVQLPARTFVHFTSAYLFEVRYPAGAILSLGALVWMAALVAAGIGAWPRGGGTTPFLRAGGVAILAVLAFALLVGDASFGYRYLLPVSGIVILVLSVRFESLWRAGRPGRRAAAAALAALVLTGGLSVLQGSLRTIPAPANDPYLLSGEEIDLLVRDLLARDVRHVYSLDPLLQWSLMFASGEEIRARWLSREDRYPPYPAAVDRALQSGEKVAVVGRIAQADYLRLRLMGAGHVGPRPRPVGGRLFVLYGPDRRLLEALGFQIGGR
jgi:hypothetical protein